MLLSLRNHWLKTLCNHLAATYIDARFRLLEELGRAGLRPLDTKFLTTIVQETYFFAFLPKKTIPMHCASRVSLSSASERVEALRRLMQTFC